MTQPGQQIIHHVVFGKHWLTVNQTELIKKICIYISCTISLIFDEIISNDIKNILQIIMAAYTMDVISLRQRNILFPLFDRDLEHSIG